MSKSNEITAPKLTPSELVQHLEFCVLQNEPALIVGRPGIGKTDIIKQVSGSNTLLGKIKQYLGLSKIKLITSHPVTADPIDYKGMPWVEQGKADFLPFGDLEQLINPDPDTLVIFFVDDFGQSLPSVQAALMQLWLNRSINNHHISPNVRFVAATNDKQHKAAVTGAIEPFKSRNSIVELFITIDEWSQWALQQQDIPTELIAAARFRPKWIEEWEGSSSIANSPCPRNLAACAKFFDPEYPKSLRYKGFASRIGEIAATELGGFLKLYDQLPAVEEIILNPNKAPVPPEPSSLHALIGALMGKTGKDSFGQIMKYLERVPEEYSVFYTKNILLRKPEIAKTTAFTEWASKSDTVNLLI